MMDVVRDLRARTRGEVLEPQDAAYQGARAAYNALATGQPAYIFRPADVADIVAAVRWAVEADLPIGVRGGEAATAWLAIHHRTAHFSSTSPAGAVP